MCIWVIEFCRNSIEPLRPDQLLRGIKKRLAVVTYLLLPEEEEDPKAVSKRLRLEATPPGSELRRRLILPGA